MISYLALLASIALAKDQSGNIPGNLYPDDFDFSSIDPALPNMQENLFPPNDKMWRGSTVESDITFDPAYFQETYGVPL